MRGPAGITRSLVAPGGRSNPDQAIGGRAEAPGRFACVTSHEPTPQK
jgi:hypothetical protein